jgi:biopolymer transport protein ExbB
MILLQTVEPTEAVANEASLNLFDLAVKGGWIMIPLVLLGILAIYIFFERLLVIRKASYKDTTFMDKIKDYINEGKIDAAITLCKNTDTPYSRMIEKGISRLGRPMNDVSVAIENVGNIEIGKLERGMSLLATIAGGGPMIGFLGTVAGMMEAFFNMANAGNNVDISLLSNGIYVAMVTTVAGLVVGIIAFFAYNYLTSKVDEVVNNMEARSVEFMDILNAPAE